MLLGYNIPLLNPRCERSWAKYNLQEFHDYADRIKYISQIVYEDYTKGAWYYISDRDVQIDGTKYKVIYFGTFGNENSPGHSRYTWAHVFSTTSDYEMECFDVLKGQLENAPEYLDPPDPDDEQDQDKDGNGYPDRF